MALDLGLPAGPLTAQLVDIDSVSGGEQALADAIEAALKRLPHLSVHRDGNALIARTRLGRQERVILAGHIDTVPIAGNIPSRTEQGIVYGCGSSDMKSGVAIQLRLAATVAAPARDVTYVFYDCEEVESARNGLLRLSRAVPDQLTGSKCHSRVAANNGFEVPGYDDNGLGYVLPLFENTVFFCLTSSCRAPSTVLRWRQECVA